MTVSDEGCSAADACGGITIRVHTFSARATFSCQAHQRRVSSDGVGWVAGAGGSSLIPAQ